MKHELQDLIQGKGADGPTGFIQQIAGYLRASKKAGTANEAEKYSKQQEESLMR